MKYIFTVLFLYSLFYNRQAMGATAYVHPALANYNAPAKHGKNSRPVHSVPVRVRTPTGK